MTEPAGGTVETVEVVATSIDGVRAAITGGAQRIHLCANLTEGGTTPSAGLILEAGELARLAAVPVMVLIRPRGGDFVYDAEEVEVMVADLRAGRRIGSAGFVLGCLTAEGWVDVDLTRRLVEEAQGKPVTFHRAVDAAVDPIAAANSAFQAGCRRVLTSGGAETALVGADVIRQMVSRAPSGGTVVAAGGIRPGTVAEVVQRTGVREVHLSARTAAPARGPRAMGHPPTGVVPDWPVASWPVPDPAVVRAVRAAVG